MTTTQYSQGPSAAINCITISPPSHTLPSRGEAKHLPPPRMVGGVQHGKDDRRSRRNGLAKLRRDLLVGMDSPVEEMTVAS